MHPVTPHNFNYRADLQEETPCWPVVLRPHSLQRRTLTPTRISDYPTPLGTVFTISTPAHAPTAIQLRRLRSIALQHHQSLFQHLGRRHTHPPHPSHTPTSSFRPPSSPRVLMLFIQPKPTGRSHLHSLAASGYHQTKISPNLLHPPLPSPPPTAITPLLPERTRSLPHILPSSFSLNSLII